SFSRDWSSDVCSSDLPETVRSYLQFNIGDAYDAGKADRSLRALFGTGLFADVEIGLQGNVVVVTIVENPVVNQVAFEGNSEVDRSEERRVGKEGRCRW